MLLGAGDGHQILGLRPAPRFATKLFSLGNKQRGKGVWKRGRPVVAFQADNRGNYALAIVGNLEGKPQLLRKFNGETRFAHALEE